MAISKDDIIKALEEMSITDLNDLVKSIEEHFDVVAAAGAAAPSEVSVLLKDAGGQKVAVIKVVKEVTGLGLMDAKKLVDGTLPAPIKENIKPEEADKIKADLEAAGATVEVK